MNGTCVICDQPIAEAKDALHTRMPIGWQWVYADVHRRCQDGATPADVQHAIGRLAAMVQAN